MGPVHASRWATVEHEGGQVRELRTVTVLNETLREVHRQRIRSAVVCLKPGDRDAVLDMLEALMECAAGEVREEAFVCNNGHGQFVVVRGIKRLFGVALQVVRSDFQLSDLVTRYRAADIERDFLGQESVAYREWTQIAAGTLTGAAVASIRAQTIRHLNQLALPA